MTDALFDNLRALFKPSPAWFTLFAAVLLTIFGSYAIDTVKPLYAWKQTHIWLPIAMITMLIVMVPHPRWMGLASYPLLVVSVLSLVYLLIPGVPLVRPINGARSWISLPGMGLQPAEFVKILYVLGLARYLRYRNSYRTFLGLFTPFLLMFVPLVLILKQPDLGTALLFAPTLFAMLVAAGAKLRHLFSLVALGVMAIVIVVAITLLAPENMQLLKPHQQVRIRSVFSLAQGDMTANKDDAFQQATGMRLIAQAGFFGNQKEESQTIIKYSRIPEPHNDMIFPVLVNRWGFCGIFAILGLYFVFISSALLVAARSKDPFVRLSCVGFAAMIFTQATVNIGMCLGLLPITGITLPFISYGGSSVLSLFIITGLIVNFAARPNAILARPSFEYDNADAIYQ
ncbi:Peptidoglycan glycosyltransferase MrdB [Poriferisphaera corsica]|uniref:Probable peptidoglycan glycosyltransferase FtsW n=1 Tax=Poriferisphaera corsica TaxID=2528020 RepID=A0A517YUR9_9BACT|nr:FtsW/RodA/SpoVE family cell cycle protein [Poriferisphaera corsica]QDU33956.1 Peptidoglycan glycosyltransferase MrdB [Poriferisphaera corsica]